MLESSSNRCSRERIRRACHVTWRRLTKVIWRSQKTRFSNCRRRKHSQKWTRFLGNDQSTASSLLEVKVADRHALLRSFSSHLIECHLSPDVDPLLARMLH